jgi:hypothetical protein
VPARCRQVYKQKVKHLLYEHQNNITLLKVRSVGGWVSWLVALPARYRMGSWASWGDGSQPILNLKPEP